MSSSNVGMEVPLKAAGDLSGGQYLGMTLSADDTVNYPAAVNDVPLGVLQNKPAAAGRGARVCVCGVTKAYFGATLSAGDQVTLSASGWFTKQTSGQAGCGQVITGANSGFVGKLLFGIARTNVSVSSVNAGQI